MLAPADLGGGGWTPLPPPLGIRPPSDPILRFSYLAD